MEASIDIAAPPGRVWSILADLEGYRDWNPFITDARGVLVKGARLSLTIQPVGGSPVTFAPTLLDIQEPRLIAWRGRLIIPGLFDGMHTITILPTGADRVRFKQAERFTGLLTPFVDLGPFLQGWHAMNAAIKHRAETLATVQSNPQGQR
jgi:hypothetical protein